MGNEPLLRSKSYLDIIDTLTPQEAQEAQALLKPMLDDFLAIDRNSFVVLAYLIGVREGIHQMRNEDSRKSISEHLSEIYSMGKAHGLATATLMFNKGDTINFALQKQLDYLVNENKRLRAVCGCDDIDPFENFRESKTE